MGVGLWKGKQQCGGGQLAGHHAQHSRGEGEPGGEDSRELLPGVRRMEISWRNSGRQSFDNFLQPVPHNVRCKMLSLNPKFLAVDLGEGVETEGEGPAINSRAEDNIPHLRGEIQVTVIRILQTITPVKHLFNTNLNLNLLLSPTPPV